MLNQVASELDVAVATDVSLTAVTDAPFKDSSDAPHTEETSYQSNAERGPLEQLSVVDVNAEFAQVAYLGTDSRILFRLCSGHLRALLNTGVGFLHSYIHLPQRSFQLLQMAIQ